MRRQAMVLLGACALLCISACSQREHTRIEDTGTEVPTPDSLAELGGDSGEVDSDEPAEFCAVPAGRGCECEVDGDCASGFCLGVPEGHVCAVACDQGCQADERCGGISGGSGKMLWVCLPAQGVQCAACAGSVDCGDTTCVEWDLGKACLVGCDANHACLEGESCWESPEGVFYCMPALGSCACTPQSKGQRRSCLLTNDFGSCVGTQQCSGAAGWGACEGTSAAPEQCNGADDDCDKEVDEGDLCPASTDGCSQAACIDGACASEALDELEGSPCTPLSSCQFMGECVQGICQGQPVDCDDLNPCTDNQCIEGVGCQKTIVEAQCDDGNPCTLGDQCIQGKCKPVALEPSCLGACGDGTCGYLENMNSCGLDCGWCGDGTCGLCEWLLPVSTCPQDCEAACGDGQCQGGENTGNCLVDCSGCGDGFCGLQEDGTKCNLDCPASCGNQICEPTEGPNVCPYDCAPSCGDEVCEAPENWFSCPEDCTVCGDHVCGSGEMETCHQDCTALCGNALCEGGENPEVCAVDCGPCGDSVCGHSETHITCPWDCDFGCGDGVCAAWLQENETACPADCGVPDDDGDSIPTVTDNCPWIMNVGQEDVDGDGKGDDCDGDKDGDQEANVTDCAPFDATIHHGVPDVCDGVDTNCDGNVDSASSCADATSCTVDLCGGTTGCVYLPRDAWCHDYMPCTYDSCSPSETPGTGCLYQVVPDGTPCTDTGLVPLGFPSPDGRVCTGGLCACFADCSGKQCGSDGCGGECGFCPAGQQCLADGSCLCIRQCLGRKCGPDGCGGSCGQCGTGATCTTEGQCTCPPATLPCGDSCCASGQLCIGGACCEPSCDGKQCGSDGCGSSCGACSAGQDCVWPGVCQCIPQCAGKHCGSDGCGGVCGTCAAGWSCNVGNCTCTPDCFGMECGADGCGGTCGICPPGDTCASGKCVTELSSNCAEGWCTIPWGIYTMGSPQDETCRHFDLPAHPVAINNSFVIRATEFTVADWFNLMPIGPAGTLTQPARFISWYDAIFACNSLSTYEGLPECYVMSNCTGVPGSGCAEGQTMCQGDFQCEKVQFLGTSCLGYRLPTEAEWEYAARAGASGATPLGDLTGTCDCTADSKLEAVAWYCGNAGSVQTVGQKLANSWGLFDVLGNVGEWVQDNNGYYGSGMQTDPVGSQSGQGGVVRGGSFSSEQRGARFADRSMQPKQMRSQAVGFRPVRSEMPVCSPNCGGKVCGPDGCGSLCGLCAAGERCLAGACALPNAGTCEWGFCFAPSGSFNMGSLGTEACFSPIELPSHLVHLSKGLWVMQTEVTQADWYNVVGGWPSTASACGLDCPVESISFPEAAFFANLKSIQEGYEPCYTFSTDCTGMPGYCVGAAACAYRFTCTDVETKGPSCEGYRIPTEAEWEYFARAGTTTELYTGDMNQCDGSPPALVSIAVFGGLASPAACRTLAPNPWGILDVAGNVAEFVEDNVMSYPAAEQNDPMVLGFPRCPGFRGGSYLSTPGQCRHSARPEAGLCNSGVQEDVGFRLVRTVGGEP